MHRITKDWPCEVNPWSSWVCGKGTVGCHIAHELTGKYIMDLEDEVRHVVLPSSKEPAKPRHD